jgi:hypothetical protein
MDRERSRLPSRALPISLTIALAGLWFNIFFWIEPSPKPSSIAISSKSPAEGSADMLKAIDPQKSLQRQTRLFNAVRWGGFGGILFGGIFLSWIWRGRPMKSRAGIGITALVFGCLSLPHCIEITCKPGKWYESAISTPDAAARSRSIPSPGELIVAD